MAVKGPNGRDPSLDVYDVPPSVEKGLPLSNHHAVSSQGILGPHGLRPDLYKEFWVCLCCGAGTHVCRDRGNKKRDNRRQLCPLLCDGSRN